MSDELYSASEFAELVEHAAVHVRMRGKHGAPKTLLEHYEVFHEELRKEEERRAAALARDAAARGELRLIRGSAQRDPRGVR